MKQLLRISRRARVFLGLGLLLPSVLNLLSCGSQLSGPRQSSERPKRALEVLLCSWLKDQLFEHNFFKSFGERNRILVQFVPNTRLALYQQLFRAHSSKPDLAEIDIVWPGILSDDLIDLRPFLKESTNDFAPGLLDSYTVQGRLLALPMFVDVGVLYYRADLLEKYGFRRPPRTWDELEMMAARIQQGERRKGNKDFWGYVWQGALSEGGTCNALEWQSSAGAGNFVENTGRVHVRSALFVAALKRALRWMGSISPPAEYVYWEDDSMNLWDSGHTAFMRNWASGYGHISENASKHQWRIAVAPLPGAAGGHRGTLGGLGMGISKYAANRDLAIKALFELGGQAGDLERLMMTNGIPSHITVSERQDVKSRTLLLATSSELMKGLVARPSGVLGTHYAEASHAYAMAVNNVLRRKQTPESALADLETKLVALTGLPAQRD